MNGSQKPATRWPQLALAMLALFFAGILYAWSVLKSPFAKEFGWDASQLALNYTLTMCFFCIGGLASGLGAKYLSTRIRAIVAAVCIFAGFWLISRMSGRHVMALYVGYGIVPGFGIGVIYNVVIGTAQAWYPDKKGLCSGLLMMSFGLSSLVLGKVCDLLFVPRILGWRKTYLLLGIVLGAVVLIAGLLVRAPGPEDVLPVVQKKKDPVVHRKRRRTTGKKGGSSAAAADFTPLQMLKTRSFWLLFLFFILLSAIGNVIFSFAKDYLVLSNVSISFAVTMVGLVSLCNGLGRIVSGLMYDRLGMKKTQLFVCVCGMIAPLVCLLAAGRFGWLACLGAGFCGFCFGFSPTLTVSSAAGFFGQKNFALNLSILNLFLIPSSFTANLAGLFIKSAGGYNAVGGYTASFVMLTVFLALGLVLTLVIKKPEPPQSEKD